MKQLLGEYVGDNSRTAKIVIDDVGVISVQLWDDGVLLNEQQALGETYESVTNIARSLIT